MKTTVKYKTVKTVDEWATVKAMGDYEADFRNGELWYFGGEYWYLSPLELSPEVLKEVNEYNEGPITL